MTRVSPFFVLVVASGLAHLAGAGGALVYLSGEKTATDEKASIRIALGSRGAAAGQPVEIVPQEAPIIPQETHPEPKPVPKPMPRALPERQVAVEPVQEAEPEAVTEEVAKRQPVEAVSQPSILPGNSGLAGTTSDTDVDTEGEDAEAGYQVLLASYDGVVLGHLAKFKTFPSAARMRGEEGNVDVEFVIDRDGRLIECRLLESSGSRRLDKAALRQLRSAVPYPTAPVQADWSIRTYRTQMRFSLN